MPHPLIRTNAALCTVRREATPRPTASGAAGGGSRAAETAAEANAEAKAEVEVEVETDTYNIHLFRSIMYNIHGILNIVN